MSKEYEISKVEDFLNVPDDRLEAMLIDFRLWYAMARPLYKVGVAKSPKFTWIDDGEHHMKFVNDVDGKTVYDSREETPHDPR